jgi:serine/threonine protein kinase
MALEPGQIIEGKYRIVRLLGEGGMGAVFEGENIRIQRRVAIKVLHPAFTANADVTERFQREAQAAGRIGNDHILEVLDLGTLQDGSHFMVLEYLDGETLSSRVKSLGRLMPRQAAPLIEQVLAGLSAAHEAGIVHRDLKPDNIFILKKKAGHSDYVKIIDFGISKFQPLAGDGMKMTSTGAVMGTPYYMSPEQASGSRNADARSDLYAVGVILYECVTGRVPFDGETFNQLMFKIVLSDPPPLNEIVPDLDPAFASIVLKAMARDVEHRFQSAQAFADALTEWSEKGTSVSVPPPTAQATRQQLASVPGLSTSAIIAPAVTAAKPQGTIGTFATSQVGVAPAKNTVVMAAVAGGVALAAIIGGILVFHGSGSSNGANANAAASGANIAAVVPVPVAPPAPNPPAVVPAPVAVAPAVTPHPEEAKASAPEIAAAAKAPVSAASHPPASSSASHAKPAAKPAAKSSTSEAVNRNFGY